MLTGLALLIAGAVFIALWILLPRLHAGLSAFINPQMQTLVAAFSPEMSRLMGLLRPASVICGVLGIVMLVLGVYAFTVQSIPLWLHIVALVAFLDVLVLLIGLALAAKKLRPLTQQGTGKRPRRKREE